jgi:uncharacterized membrane protein YbaN (DUF454 family)
LSRKLTARRYFYLALGACFVALGFVGAFLPLLPTTPFLLLALACFARSSPALHDWLLSHPIMGKYIRDWERDRSIPLPAKILSVMMMSASLAWLAFGTKAPAIAVWMTGGILFMVAFYILTRPTTRR